MRRWIQSTDHDTDYACIETYDEASYESMLVVTNGITWAVDPATHVQGHKSFADACIACGLSACDFTESSEPESR